MKKTIFFSLIFLNLSINNACTDSTQNNKMVFEPYENKLKNIFGLLHH